MSSSVHVEAPVDRVWRTISDAKRWPQWSRVCVEVWGVPDDSRWSVGQRFGFKLRMVWRNVPFNVTVSYIEPGKEIEWRSTKFSITAIRKISVTDENDGCRVVDSKQFSSPFLPIQLAYPRWLIRRMTRRWLDDIRMESEFGQ